MKKKPPAIHIGGGKTILKPKDYVANTQKMISIVVLPAKIGPHSRPPCRI